MATRLKNKGFMGKKGKKAGYSMKEHLMFIVYNLFILDRGELEVDLIYEKVNKIKGIDDLYWSHELKEGTIEFKLKHLFTSNDSLGLKNIDKISSSYEHFCPSIFYNGVRVDMEFDHIFRNM